MRNPIDSVTQFCLIQLEILKTRESRLRKELQDCNIQREFLSQTLQDLGRKEPIEKDIVSNRELILSKSDSLGSLIEDVAYDLNELSRNVDKHFISVEQNIRDIEESFDSQRRRINRRISDIEQNVSILQTGLKEIEALSIIQTEKAKAEENKKE